MKCRAAGVWRSLPVPPETAQCEDTLHTEPSPGARSPAPSQGSDQSVSHGGEQDGEGLEDKAERTTSGSPLLHTATSCPSWHRPGYTAPS